ncbi:MAG TPA: hypothetical protein VJL87_00045, partial [Bdellovibrionota bacterium]|nr:hypothetical protein [Bdellovibrionota bacterium]
GDIFQLRKCQGNWCRAQIATKSCTLGPAPVANNPCIYFQLGTCSAPCSGKISRENYRKKVEQAVAFLERKETSFLKDLIFQREDASRKLKYELAGKIQNQVTQLTQLLKFQELLSSAVHLNHCLILTPSSSKDGQTLFVICAGRLVLQREFSSSSQNDIHVIVEEASAMAPSPFDAIKKEEVDEIGIIARWLRLNSSEGKVIPLTWDDQRGLSLPHRNDAAGQAFRRRQPQHNLQTHLP